MNNIIADEYQLHHQSPDADDAQQKKDTILERREEFPSRLRTAIDEAKEENLSPTDFLSTIECKLVDWLVENWDVVRIDKSKGLNCDRDTEKEVELAIRFFPKVLSMKRNGKYLIYWQLRNCFGECNLKAALFVPLFAKLAIELNQCKEGERGGLTDGYDNVLRRLADIYWAHRSNDEERRQLVDETSFAVMKKLRDDGLFKPEDILEYDLLRISCSKPIFPDQWFRYLADWDPSCLMATLKNGMLPVHYAILECKDIRGFRTVLEVIIHHFPKEMGSLFRRNGDDETAYQMACDRFGNEEVKQILDCGFGKNHCSMLKSLVYAATEETVHLDGVFEVLRREPSVLL